MINKTILSKAEAARVCEIAPKTIYSWANKGKITKYYAPKYRETFMVCKEEILFLKESFKSK